MSADSQEPGESASTDELLGHEAAPAALALADGTIYRGRAFGARTVQSGEVVLIRA